MKQFTLTTVAALGITAMAAAGSGEFTIIGPGRVADMTPDGQYVLGNNGDAFIWTAGDGITVIPGGSGVAISDDGTTVLGQILDEELGKNVAALWTSDTGWVSLEGLPGEQGCDANLSNPYDLSGDAGVAVGLGWEGCSGRAFRWTEETGMLALPQIGTRSARANAVSPNGQIIGGWDEAETGPRLAAIWSSCDEILPLAGINGNDEGLGEVWAFNSCGTIAVGQAHHDLTTGGAFRYMNDTVTIIPALPGTDPQFHTIASLALTEDGSTVYGTNISGFGPFADQDATIWDADNGVQKLQDVAEAAGIEIPKELVLAQAEAATPDGSMIAGTARDFITPFAFLMTLPGSDCPEDIDGDGAVDFDDLLRVLSAWGPCP